MATDMKESKSSVEEEKRKIINEKLSFLLFSLVIYEFNCFS